MGWSEGLGGGILITVLLILTFLPPTDPSRRATTRRGEHMAPEDSETYVNCMVFNTATHIYDVRNQNGVASAYTV